MQYSINTIVNPSEVQGELTEAFYELVVEGRVVGLYTSLEALGVAIETIKAIVEGRLSEAA